MLDPGPLTGDDVRQRIGFRRTGTYCTLVYITMLRLLELVWLTRELAGDGERPTLERRPHPREE